MRHNIMLLSLKIWQSLECLSRMSTHCHYWIEIEIACSTCENETSKKDCSDQP